MYHITRHRFFRIFSILAGIILLALLLIAAGTYWYIHSAHFRQFAAHTASEKSGREITLDGDIDIQFKKEPRVVLHQVVVGNSDWSKDPAMFRAERIEFSFRLLPLLSLTLEIPELIIEKPYLVLEKNAAGKNNWSFTQNPAATPLKAATPDERSEIPLIGKLVIHDGKIIYRNATQALETEIGISTVTGENQKEATLQLEGKGTLQKSPFLIKATGASLLQLREADTPYPFKLTTRVGDTHAELEGTVQDPVQLKDLNVLMKLRGKNAADLFPITGIVLPPTPPYSIEGKLDYAGDHWEFNHFRGKMGNSDLKGQIAWYHKRRPPFLKGEFISENLDMKDLAGFIGANKAPANPSRVIPDTPLDISRLTAMDADATFQGKRVKTPDLLDNFFMHVILDDRKLTLKPVSFLMAKGKIEADVTINSRENPPVITSDVLFNRLSMTQLFAPLAERYGEENVAAGLIGGRAKLEGSGKSLHEMLGSAKGMIGVGMEGGQLSRLLLELVGLDLFKAAQMLLEGDAPVPINCVIGDFSLTSGTMQTRTMLIDTSVTTIEGSGTINLKNEALDMQLNVTPKDATLFSLRSPIHIEGTLKKPDIKIDKAALAARGGAGIALSVVLTPIGALLAFIEPGLGEDSQCLAYVRQLDKKTGGAIP